MLNKFWSAVSQTKNAAPLVAQSNVLEKLNAVSPMIPLPNALAFFSRLQDVYITHRETKVQLESIEAQRDILIMELENKYDLYHKVFDNIFDERKIAINKSFEIIDEGLKNNDRDLINIGMHNLSTVVASSPFANIEQLTHLIESGQKIQI